MVKKEKFWGTAQRFGNFYKSNAKYISPHASVSDSITLSHEQRQDSDIVFDYIFLVFAWFYP